MRSSTEKPVAWQQPRLTTSLRPGNHLQCMTHSLSYTAKLRKAHYSSYTSFDGLTVRRQAACYWLRGKEEVEKCRELMQKLMATEAARFLQAREQLPSTGHCGHALRCRMPRRLLTAAVSSFTGN